MESVHYDISIIIPVYNVEKYIEGCLNSIINQRDIDNLKIECIIVNDCSTDTTLDIIEKTVCANKGNIIFKIINQEKNKGVSAARNRGLDVAKGEYIFFMDSDDDLEIGCIKHLYDEAKKNGFPDLLVGTNYNISINGKKEIFFQLANSRYTFPKSLQAFCEHKWPNVVWNKLYKSSIIYDNNLRFAEGKILEDELWSFQIAALAKTVMLVGQPTYNHYVRSGSILSSVWKTNKRWMSFLAINELIHDFIIDEELDGNPHVAKFFLDKLLGTLNGFRGGAIA